MHAARCGCRHAPTQTPTQQSAKAGTCRAFVQTCRCMSAKPLRLQGICTTPDRTTMDKKGVVLARSSGQLRGASQMLNSNSKPLRPCMAVMAARAQRQAEVLRQGLQCSRCGTKPGVPSTTRTGSGVQEAGEGQPVVLVHGFGASVGQWRRTIPEISKHNKVRVAFGMPCCQKH